MSNHALLNNVDHKDLKISRKRNADMGDQVMFCMTFPVEFRSVQHDYPIFFRKDAQTGEFMPVAMFGFEQKENLFLKDDKWDAGYIPLVMDRDPFLIGFQQDRETGEKKPVIHINMDSPRVSSEEGEAVFLEHGGQTPYLEKISSMLQAIHAGQDHGKAFVQKLVEYELLESFTLEVELNDGTQNQLIGFYTIHEEKVNALAAEALADLHKEGFLQSIYMVLASMSSIRDLIERKNQTLLNK
ncbi:SapC family protein [Catenovulum sp. SX2]|uniref:SapC family protein n=1 Tax=Catenovulum sp. SX2 TaxID=3398614 RepID=UPI003F84C26A